MFRDIEVQADEHDAIQNLLQELHESGELNPSEVSTVEIPRNAEDPELPF